MFAVSNRIAAVRGMVRRWWRSPPVWLVLLGAAVVAVAPGWWVELAVAGVVGVRRFWLPIVLAAGGLLALEGWYRRWRAAVRPARPPAGSRRWPLFSNVAVLLLVAALAAVAVGALLWWALGTPDVGATPTPALSQPPVGTPSPDTAPDSWTVQNTFDAIKIVLAVVAGIGGVVALTVAYRKQHHGEAAEHREDTKLFNERFGKAADQLGADKAAVRLAGVYALAGLADDWAESRQTCIEVLCAYLRMPYTPPAENPGHAAPAAAVLVELPLPTRLQCDDDAERRQERQVRHTILTVIGAHLRPPRSEDPRPRWHGHRFDLRGAVLDGGNLRGIHVSDGTMLDFSHAIFPGGMVDFGSTMLSGGAMNFDSAIFSGGEVDFFGATLSGGWVAFGYATVSGGKVDFGGATFSGGMVDFSVTTISDGIVGFGAATFSGGEAHFGSAMFSGGWVHFGGAKFSAGRVGFGGATFSAGRLGFDGATFSGGEVHFDSAKFTGGLVDFRAPRDWRVPPMRLDGLTPGVVWPSPEHLAELRSKPELP